MQKRYAKLNNAVLCCLLAVCLLFSCFLSLGAPPARADTTYSDVLVDLQKDSTFDASKYSTNDTDYSLQVIQLAESVNGELFIYVYQPSGQVKDLRANSINISTSIGDSFSPKNYDLTFVNSNGVFYKYRVIDFKILPDNLRYYSIVSIFRPYDNLIDKKPEGDNTISAVSYEVGKLFTATTINDVVSYSCITTETILITDKYVGFIRYFTGSFININSCDSHYVAFNTDKFINKLMSADVTYISRSYSKTGVEPLPIYNYGESKTSSITLTHTDKTSTTVNGLFASSYTWKRIQSVNDFISSENLTDETKNSLKNKKWVLRFAETDFKDSYPISTGTEVTDVTILRLQFETFGVVYNLGVVDNKQSGDLIPDNIVDGFNSLPDWLKYLIYALIAIALTAVIIPFAPFLINVFVWLFKAIVFVLKYLFIGLYYILKYLFIGIGYLFVGLYYAIAWPFYLIFRK